MNPAELYNTGYFACRVSEVRFSFSLSSAGTPVGRLLPPLSNVKSKPEPSKMSAAALTARGHRCILAETHERNTVELVVSGELVFTCRIKQLEFGGDGKLDPVCKEAVAAVENAY